MMHQHKVWKLAAAAALAVLFVASTGYAAQKSACLVDRVDTDGNRIAIWCQGDANIYYAFKNGFNTSCATANADTLKMWLSQAQAALLSGKPLHLFFDAPASACVDRSITSVGLKRL